MSKNSHKNRKKNVRKHKMLALRCGFLGIKAASHVERSEKLRAAIGHLTWPSYLQSTKQEGKWEQYVKSHHEHRKEDRAASKQELKKAA